MIEDFENDNRIYILPRVQRHNITTSATEMIVDGIPVMGEGPVLTEA